MSKILSYNNKTSGEGWIPLDGQYNADEIEMIADPNAGLSARPKTAIPSPFAQMDLVKNAFKRLAMHRDLHGEVMDEILVSNALDIGQLFYNFSEVSQKVKIVEWNRRTELQKLKDTPEHRLLGETFEMFLEQDKEAFNFDLMDRLFFLVCQGRVIGGTSPVTLFMASPNARKGDFDIPVEQNEPIFGRLRPLYERDHGFVKYLYALFAGYPDLKKKCQEMDSYLIANFPLLTQDLRDAILNDIGNPTAIDAETTERALSLLESSYAHLDEGVEALGIPFYGVRQVDILQAIRESDFVIRPSREVSGDLPLVLQNHLYQGQTDSYRYITNLWDDTTTITPQDYALPIDKRILPATTHQYPWLTDDDLLEPTLIKLDYTMNRDCFFDGNLSVTAANADNNDFLLPLKPLFFKYFNTQDLWGTINGRPRFELLHGMEGRVETVTAVLRIPVRKQGGFITLRRTYTNAANTDVAYDVKANRGRFMTIPFALAIFPFVRDNNSRQYNVQLVDRALGLLSNYTLKADFYADGYENRLDDDHAQRRDRSLKPEKSVGSCYYKIDGNFDYATITVQNENGMDTMRGVLCPRWPAALPGHDGYTFAVDFGTTNTHVESMRDGEMPQPLSLNMQASTRLLATLYNGESMLYDVILKQEFLPKALGADYGFPQRTVLSESQRLDAANVDVIQALGDANIPFIYEKESVGYGNRIVANLKWSTDMANSKRVEAYLREIVMLMRAKVLIENGDLMKTRLVWFYPLAMKIGNVHRMTDIWRKTFRSILGVEPTRDNLVFMPESVAPYYYYRNTSRFRGAASTVAAIDIGGGSSDVAIYESNAQQPALLSSFRFAANVLFGDGFSEVPRADHNPMLRKYVDYFRRLFNADDDRYGELNGILDDITAKGKSEDINAFLFSVFDNKAVQGNDVFSYNLRLNEDSQLKIVFLYFYAAIIYYVARVMHQRQIEKPRSVMFSGTGSKVLSIVGAEQELSLVGRLIFERVYGSEYGSEDFSVIMERKEPKQITCRGALLQVREQKGRENIDQLNHLMDDIDHPLEYFFGLKDHSPLHYEDMDSAELRRQVVGEVETFNQFFIQLCDDIRVTDRFLVDNRSMQRFRELVGKDLEHHLLNGWNFFNKNTDDHNAADPIEDSVFFYPIIGSIRDNLIENLLS